MLRDFCSGVKVLEQKSLSCNLPENKLAHERENLLPPKGKPLYYGFLIFLFPVSCKTHLTLNLITVTFFSVNRSEEVKETGSVLGPQTVLLLPLGPRVKLNTEL